MVAPNDFSEIPPQVREISDAWKAVFCLALVGLVVLANLSFSADLTPVAFKPRPPYSRASLNVWCM